MSRSSAIEELKKQLTLPVVGKEPWADRFDPWEIFPCFYGSYSSEFDDMAILVLENIRDGKFGPEAGEALAHEMFREVLCNADLCDYGTSPRGCSPNWEIGFDGLLPALIAKWREYRAAEWGDEE